MRLRVPGQGGDAVAGAQAQGHQRRRCLAAALRQRGIADPLHGADPGETGTASAEITGGAYTRKQATITITGNTASLNQTITWEGMPAVSVGGVGIWSAQTGGTMLVHLALAQSKTVTAGDSLVISAGNLAVSAD